MPNLGSFSTQVELRSAPINPAWITQGAPTARNHVLWNSTDRTGWAMVWDCTAGKFSWNYTVDELVHVLEGGMTVTGPDGAVRSYKAGDVVFFPAGIVAHWHIDNYVRKLAYCQNQLPAPIALPLRLARRMMALVRENLSFLKGSLARPAVEEEQCCDTAKTLAPARTRK